MNWDDKAKFLDYDKFKFNLERFMIRWVLLLLMMMAAVGNCNSENSLAGVPCLGALNEQDRNWWEEKILQKKNKTGAAPLECAALALALRGSGSLPAWTRFQESTNYAGFPYATFRNNAIYFVGSGRGSFENSSESSNNISLIFGKYDLSGNLEWRKEILSGASNGVLFRSQVVDSQANLIAVIQLSNNLAFDGTTATNDSDNIVIVKFDPNGNKLWTKRYGSTTNSQSTQAFSVHVDNNDDILVAGNAQHALNGATYVAGRSAGYIMRLDKATGDPKNTRMIYTDTTSAGIQAYSIAVDSANNVFVSGRFSTVADPSIFDVVETGSGISTTNKTSYFVMKLDPTLASRQWAVEIQSDKDSTNKLILDGSDLFMAFPNGTTTGSYAKIGNTDIGISKLAINNGSIAFTKTIGFSGVNFNSVPEVSLNPRSQNFRFVGNTALPFGDTALIGTRDAFILEVNKEGTLANKEFIGTANTVTSFTNVTYSDSGSVIFAGGSDKAFQDEPKTTEQTAGFITTAVQK
ncbi:hypothetical protein [Leptospira sp. GIMC2001]|uniref:hypothetical protein n=1 Tax=Leptospira sp. GIMC2001 TaxID=1513297 RepID=UPI0023493A29|nr:hypothetical protein [Leptospira sp. GIMC2001]WCL47730.1 hypothetical protein O4O04_00300 [Leptospira sp. GIMC2001]